VRNRKYLVLALTAGLTVLPATAFANSLASTMPSNGSVLTVQPNSISVTMTSPLLSQGSVITVMAPDGTEVDDGAIAIDSATVSVGLKPLSATGVYTVTYSAIAGGDAPLNGSFTFIFNSPGAISTPTQTPSSTPSVSATPVSNTGAADTFVIVLLVLAGLVFLFLIWYARETFGWGKKKKRSNRTASRR